MWNVLVYADTFHKFIELGKRPIELEAVAQQEKSVDPERPVVERAFH